MDCDRNSAQSGYIYVPALGFTKRLMTVREFAGLYGVGITKAYEFMKNGRLRSVKVGHSTRIKTEDAEAWAASLPLRQV